MAWFTKRVIFDDPDCDQTHVEESLRIIGLPFGIHPDRRWHEHLIEGSRGRASLQYGDSDRQELVLESRIVYQRGAGFLKSLQDSPRLKTPTRMTSHE